mmetsp:Transcript_34089/g.61449  ORF Transcript_34089/g.61449 Transcript_34089/m.61449 type:complete len:136 (+) Transcript_34089:117-524(+)
MLFYSLYVINKSGGLVFNRDYANFAKVNVNDALRLASIWHSLHAISCQISPIQGCSGIELLEADTFDLHSFQTLTGTKFLLIVEKGSQYVPMYLQKIYEYYCDYVLKNPFYEIEQVIKCDLFEEEVESLLKSRAP